MRSSSKATPGEPLRAIVALGSNRCHGRHGRPPAILAAAITALEAGGFHVTARAPIIETAPVGPSVRRFANSAISGLWRGSPQELLALCKRIEADFGRRRSRRWAARVLDLDLIAVEQLEIRARGFSLPHYAMADRDFVLAPMVALWPDWRHPRLHLTVRQMLARIRKSRPARHPCPASACR